MIYYQRLIDGTLYDTMVAGCPLNRCSTNCQKPSCAAEANHTVVMDTRTWLVSGDLKILCDDVETVYLTDDSDTVSHRYYSCESAFEQLIKETENVPLLYEGPLLESIRKWVRRQK